ncbi:MAG: Calx-beta domain-containing protein [Pyrinomonadaceae bacterium]
MQKLLAGKSLNSPTRRLRVTTAALLALLLSTSITMTPASAAAGDLDPTFGEGGRVMTDFGGPESANAVAVQPDGRVIVVGVAGQDGDPAAGFGDICVVRYKPDGSLDTSFGSGGKVLIDFGDTSEAVGAVRVQPDGKILVVGGAYLAGASRSDFALARLNADGTPDASFGTNGKVLTVFPSGRGSGASSVAVQADGRIVAAGGASSGAASEENEGDLAVVRYHADGTPDDTFGAGGIATLDLGANDSAAGVAVQPDGRVVLAGSAWKFAGNLGQQLGCAVARLKADGSPDATFDGDGKTTLSLLGQDVCAGLALQPDGRVVVAGPASTNRDSTDPDFGLARLNPDGTLDPTFGEGGRVTADFKSGSDMPHGVAILPGGKIVAAGYVTGPNFSGTPEFGAVRFNPDGSPDNTFGVGGRATANFGPTTYLIARGMGVQPDGKVIVVGDANRENTSLDFAVVRFDAGSSIEPSSFARLSATNYGAAEGCAAAVVTVAREGDLSAPATVEFRTRDGSARQSQDYTQTTGTLLFAAGESSKTFAVPVNEDAFAEGAETIRVELVSASANVNFRVPAAATLTIADNDTADGSANPLDNSQAFVCQHYHDFLSRQPDAEGLQFWTQGIESCGADEQCREVKRVDVSTAFFLSIEFQQTGYFVIRAHKAAFGDNKQTPRYPDALRDTQRVAQGVVVGRPDADARLEANKQAFALALVTRPEFVATHGGQSPDTYVESLFNNAGVGGTLAERAAAHAAYGAGGDAGRAAALRSVVESESVYRRLYNPAFVLSQYFGYLRRDPDGEGYDFWLAKLDSFSLPGEDVRDERVALARVRRAEMVKAFMTSLEYRRRFGQP